MNGQTTAARIGRAISEPRVDGLATAARHLLQVTFGEAGGLTGEAYALAVVAVDCLVHVCGRDSTIALLAGFASAATDDAGCPPGGGAADHAVALRWPDTDQPTGMPNMENRG